MRIWLRSDPPDITLRAVTCDNQLIGSVAAFFLDGRTEITYWIDVRAIHFIARVVSCGCPSTYAVPARPITVPSGSLKCATTRPLGDVAGPMMRVPPSSSARLSAASTSATPT